MKHNHECFPAKVVEEDCRIYEFWVRILNASISAQPLLSSFVESELSKAKTLWETSDDSDEGYARYNEACATVEQFLSFRFDTTRLVDHSLFSRPQIQGSSGQLVVHDMDFSHGVIPTIKKAVTEVYLTVQQKLCIADDLVAWQEKHGSLVPGIVLFFKNRAPGYYDESFLHDAEGTEFTIGNGAVEFEPECQNE